jgi:hypothetical protein
MPVRVLLLLAAAVAGCSGARAMPPPTTNGAGSDPGTPLPPPRDCELGSFEEFVARVGSTDDANEFARRLRPFEGCRVHWTLRGFGGETTERPGVSDPAARPHEWLSRQRLISGQIPLGDLCTVQDSDVPVIVTLPKLHGDGFADAARPNLVEVSGVVWGTELEYSNHIALRAYTVHLVSTDPVEEQRRCGL